ncbi:DEAD/DEAH box helicase family protein [Saccharophagus degradans]|uniref:DEAD/DEAH box helicase n=1 Tax=Saccharophagus degradans TaxID=86304 RepID=UPI001C0A0210|nr:type ISP restriction/modification enzyme [Saccharophagus degradans]MBU2987255.1 DEAD/DEAH box helicase family protein [Saccharophagus degradans]
MTPLEGILHTYRTEAKTEREKGNYFEELIRTYLRHEASYADLYSDVWLYSEWALAHPEYNLSAKDTGIDLVAKTRATDEYHAIQCKCYAEDYRLQKKDIDSFFTASGQKPFSRRYIVATTNNWSDNAEAALINQQPPVTKIDLHDLENSQIDWAQYQPNTTPVLKPKYDPREHQQTAIRNVIAGLQNADRGKLIMACGTGKTFTALKLAEEMAGKGKRVLFLVPSLSLLSQTLTEWTQQSKTPLHSFAVCSDSDVGKKRKKDDDVVQTFAHELRYPATTKADKLAAEMAKRHDDAHMSVVYSTYHSIEVISKAQKEHGVADFDLIICDEAHRTTGSKFAGEEESSFVKVHDANFIKAVKRLYMTATPRIFGDAAKIKQEQGEVALFSMDDEAHYGKELHVINFSEAVSRGLLCDYKVIVLTVDEAHISQRLQSILADENNSLKVDDAAKIVGCWKALSKQSLNDDFNDNSAAMQRAVAFCQVIEPNTGKAKTHKVSSKQISGMFQEVVDAYQAAEEEQGNYLSNLKCEASHIDGGMNATEKEAQINWLKEEPPANTCRILSNVRCLSEGVDVPALDAVLFLTPRSSQVDVVQSVGRVMRKAKGKELGYIILPVVIPTGVAPNEALNDNKVYKVVWEVLQALRSHDDRFDAQINKLDLIGRDPKKMEVIAVSGDVQKRQDKSNKNKGDSARGSRTIGEPEQGYDSKGQLKDQRALQFEVGEIERALYAKIVKKCGNRNHWETWANDIAKIANTHISRITAIVSDENNTKEVEAFKGFADELRDDLNDSITDAEVIEMLAQHLITKPVFDALFEGYSFARNNPVSQAMQQVLDILQEHRLDKEADTLERFYDSVKMRADGINNAEGKQKIVVELYDKFFRNAFPRMTERLGIVYTPVEVVDFIIHSVNDLLQQEFGQTLGSEGVHILDPFTGTGTFITRLLQSGLISKEQLAHKYKNEIHCNEIVLLAYYIAAINIEAVYHAVVNDGKAVEEHTYEPFEGICLTDTFQLYEKDDLISELLADNSDRRNRQKNLDIRVIIGNPPYSKGQKSENDNAQNVKYEFLESRVRDTYSKRSTATSTKDLMDSYIKAIRWASDRVGDEGIVGFISGSGFVEKPFADGMRKSLTDEFDAIYILNLRGDIRKNIFTKGAALEGGNVFGSGSMTGIAITFLVKGGKSKGIQYFDIGDDLTTEEKLDLLVTTNSYSNLLPSPASSIQIDIHGDWLNHRDNSFVDFIEIANKKTERKEVIFRTFSQGLLTSRDAWCCNSSKNELNENIGKMTEFYNTEVERFQKSGENEARTFVDNNPQKISWSSSLTPKLEKGIKSKHSDKKVVRNMYRLFEKRWLYYDKLFNHRQSRMTEIYPDGMNKNRCILISGKGSRNGFTPYITELLPDYNILEGGAQCFPIYTYEKTDAENISGDNTDLFSNNTEEKPENGYTRKDGISNEGLAHFQQAYPNETINKEDIFYYVYGLLHSPEYRERYADNLSKELPRIPCVKTPEGFWGYSQAGRDLAELHINYETVDKYPVTLDCGKRSIDELEDSHFYVKKMKRPKVKNDEGKSVNDNSTVIYNEFITVRDIPLEAYDYVVNGKAAIEWVIERQAVTTDKKSGIVNDANDWAVETMKNPAYPLELLQRVITVSLETIKIVNALPKLDID